MEAFFIYARLKDLHFFTDKKLRKFTYMQYKFDLQALNLFPSINPFSFFEELSVILFLL